MLLKTLLVGELETNCYVLSDEKNKQAMIIDPGGDFPDIEKYILEQNLKVKYIVLTHGHIDHIGALAQLKQMTKAQVMIHKKDSEMLSNPASNLSLFANQPIDSCPADGFLEEGDQVTIGDIKFEVIHTPGHTPGGISLWTDKMIFSGDTIFFRSVGRTDLPGGSWDQLIKSIKQKILTKDDDTVIYPGHGPPTTVGEEKTQNPFLNNSSYYV